MGELIQSFNPWDPADPSYQTQEDDLYNQAYGLPEETKMAGSNFYPADENEANESDEMGESVPPTVGGMGPKVVSASEEQFENEM